MSKGPIVVKFSRQAWKSAGIGVCLAASLSTSAWAIDTINYTYDALGRLSTATYIGGPRDGQTVTYTYDAAGNRTQVVATPASSYPVVVLPLLGFLVIPLGS
jgi:hypothetical protein